MKSFIAILLTILCFSSITNGQYIKDSIHIVSYSGLNTYKTVQIKPSKGHKVKNVILMIGDGMGISHVMATWIANHGKLNIDNCNVVGMSRTWCVDELITDSGAAGTAMATGQKTNYHSIAVDTSGNELKSLTNLAHKKGLKTGILVTCNLTDATPAAFCANNPNRDEEEDIAADYLTCNVDFIFGAGREKFNKRTDGRDILTEMKQVGFQVTTTWEETKKLRNGKVFSIISEGQLPLARERDSMFVKASIHALDFLNKGNKGFFAMIEGSRIDDCGHWNKLPELIEEVSDFDRTIGQVLKWAEKDGKTLVIVVADHETGGLIVQNGNIKDGYVEASFSTGGHSGILVPVYAWGPQAKEFTGIYENTSVFLKIAGILNLK